MDILDIPGIREITGDYVQNNEIKNIEHSDAIFSPDGKWIAVSYKNTIKMLDANLGTFIKEWTDNEENIYIDNLSWSPDESKIGYGYWILHKDNNNEEPYFELGIKILDLKTQKAKKLYFNNRMIVFTHPIQYNTFVCCWSPDGKEIASSIASINNKNEVSSYLMDIQIWDSKTYKRKNNEVIETDKNLFYEFINITSLFWVKNGDKDIITANINKYESKRRLAANYDEVWVRETGFLSNFWKRIVQTDNFLPIIKSLTYNPTNRIATDGIYIYILNDKKRYRVLDSNDIVYFWDEKTIITLPKNIWWRGITDLEYNKEGTRFIASVRSVPPPRDLYSDPIDEYMLMSDKILMWEKNDKGQFSLYNFPMANISSLSKNLLVEEDPVFKCKKWLCNDYKKKNEESENYKERKRCEELVYGEDREQKIDCNKKGYPLYYPPLLGGDYVNVSLDTPQWEGGEEVEEDDEEDGEIEVEVVWSDDEE